MFKTSNLGFQHCNVTNEIPGWGKGLRKIGDARWSPNGYHSIKLNLFPRTNYFLKPHPLRIYEYILYSRRENGVLSNPVGRGEIVQGTNYIQVQFLDIKMTFFLQFLRAVKIEFVAA